MQRGRSMPQFDRPARMADGLVCPSEPGRRQAPGRMHLVIAGPQPRRGLELGQRRRELLPRPGAIAGAVVHLAHRDARGEAGVGRPPGASRVHVANQRQRALVASVEPLESCEQTPHARIRRRFQRQRRLESGAGGRDVAVCLPCPRTGPSPRGIAWSLEVFAGVLAADGRPADAARFWRLSDTLLETSGGALTATIGWIRNRYTEPVRTRMGESPFAAARAEGRLLSPDDAVALVRARGRSNGRKT